ncbi:type II toxin-antitoxin system HicB family antitoxin [Brevundimonas sp.]
MATRTYIAIVEEASEGYGVSFPDLPGCVSAGDTMEEAVAAAGEALSLHLDGMIEDGEDLPDARSLDQIDDDLGQPAGRFIYASVSADIDESSERVNVYLPKSLLDQIERFGQRTGIDNRSTFLRLASRYYIQSNPPGDAEVRAFVKETRQGGSARKVRRLIDKGSEA